MDHGDDNICRMQLIIGFCGLHFCSWGYDFLVTWSPVCRTKSSLDEPVIEFEQRAVMNLGRVHREILSAHWMSAQDFRALAKEMPCGRSLLILELSASQDVLRWLRYRSRTRPDMRQKNIRVHNCVHGYLFTGVTILQLSDFNGRGERI